MSGENTYHLRHMYDFLVGMEPSGQLSKEIGIAKDWKMSTDGLSWTFYLREGVKFHNGDDLTAEDVKFTLDRVRSQKSRAARAAFLRGIIKSVEVVGRYTVVINLNKPNIFIPYYLTGSGVGYVEGFIVPKNYIEKWGDDYFAAHPVGSGPYKFDSLVSASHLKTKAVDYHWRVGVPKYEYLTLQVVPEVSTRIAMLKTGEADATRIPAEKVKEVKAAGFNVFSWEKSMILLQLLEQYRPDNPLSKKPVRQALKLAINKQEIANALFGGIVKVTGSPAEPVAVGYDPKFEVPSPYDPATAKKLLAEAGYPNGFTLQLYSYESASVPEGPAMMEAIAGYWSAIGVKPVIVPMDYALIRTKRTAGTAGNSVLYVGAQGRTSPWPLASISATLWSKSTSGFAIKDPKMDALIDAAENAPDLAAAAARARAVYEYIMDNVFEIPVSYGAEAVATNPRKIAAWPGSRAGMDMNLEVLYRR